MGGDIVKTRGIRMVLLAGAAVIALQACDDTGQFQGFGALQNNDAPENATVTDGEAATASVSEREVEAPEVFSVTDSGLWDGRPSLGGVWVAHPDVTTPERVVVRNQSNGKVIQGALFRRERDNPGPRIQVSSDAARDLGMLAGAPAELSVIALRKETVEVVPPPAPEAPDLPETEVVAEAEAPTEVSAESLESAAAAIDAAAPTEFETTAADAIVETTETAADATTPAVEPAASARRVGGLFALRKNLIEVVTYPAEETANQTVEQLRAIGIEPTVKEAERDGFPIWRVVAGPVQTRAERTTLLATLRQAGYADAFPVAN